MATEFSRVRRYSDLSLVLVVLTIMAITVSAYGRLTGLDVIAVVMQPGGNLADLCFAIIVASGALGAAVLLSVRPEAIALTILAAVAIASGGALVLVGAASAPAEWLRFHGAPFATGALLPAAVVSVVVARQVPRLNDLKETWSRRLLLIAIASTATAGSILLASDSAGATGFFVQLILILLGAVVPLVSSSTALVKLRCDRRLASVDGMIGAAMVCTCLLLLVSLR